MKYILILLMISLTSLTAQNKQLTIKEQKAQMGIQKAIEAEKKIAKEQKFHQGSSYDLKSQEVDMSSLDGLEDKNIGEEIDAANEDFDMDDVY